MRRVIIFLFLMAVILSAQQEIVSTFTELKDVRMIDQNTGIVAIPGTVYQYPYAEILLTTDGGSTWEHFFSSGSYYQTINILSPDIFYICSEANSVYLNYYNRHREFHDCYSRNRGSFSPDSIHFGIMGTSFTDAPTEKKIILAERVESTGGISYKSVILENNNDYTEMGECSLANYPDVWFTFYNSTLNKYVLGKIDNWGDSFSYPIATDSYNKARFIQFKESNGWFVCDSNKVKYSSNSGETWNTEFTTDNNIEYLEFIDANKGIYATGNSVYMTVNKGQTWGKLFDFDVEYGFYISRLHLADGYCWYISENKLMRYKLPDTITDIEATDDNLPDNYKLSQNCPNPFNPATTISFELPETANVKLTVYNNLGEQVAVIANNQFNEGKHIVNFNAENLTSGIYFYRLTTPNKTLTNKMVLLK